MSPTSLQSRIESFEKAAAEAVDPQVMATKISNKSDRKKYRFAEGLSRDLQKTRAALRKITSEDYCTFGALYTHTEGNIANLNRVLHNLKQSEEIYYSPDIEMFLSGVHDDDVIILLPKFWTENYQVDETNVFKSKRSTLLVNVAKEDRKGRSYVAEDLQTMNVDECCVCSKRVKSEDRITLRGEVFHISCITCAVCGASLRCKRDYLTFDGSFCCSSDCVLRYDGAHVHQQRL
mmetsp:Transcript_8228/g.14909  ORF Transcript_8228/g.14909 Transcript_8228/m.14909 type:complete len:234 (+) Transcript_8228:39-740(+)